MLLVCQNGPYRRYDLGQKNQNITAVRFSWRTFLIFQRYDSHYHVLNIASFVNFGCDFYVIKVIQEAIQFSCTQLDILQETFQIQNLFRFSIVVIFFVICVVFFWYIF